MYKDNLQLDILQARAELPAITKKAIDAVKWKETISRMKKYSPEQLKVLEKKTELLLCGLLKTDDYPKELGLEMGLSRESTASLITEMDILVFEKIQNELEKEIEKENLFVENDPLFSGLPENIQEAIAKSDWKEKTYEIAQKYKLNIEQMGILEDLTVKTMKNEIRPNDYKNRLAEKIKIPNEFLVNLIDDINQNVLSNIVNIVKTQEQTVLLEEEKKRDNIIPTPPYQKESNSYVAPDKKTSLGIPLPPKTNNAEFVEKKPDIINQEENFVNMATIPLPLNKSQNKILGINIEKDDKKTPTPVIIKEVVTEKPETPQNGYQVDPYREKI